MPVVAKKQLSTAQKVGQSVERMAAKAGISAGAAGAISYYLLRRQQAAEIFGMQVPEFALDGVLLAVDSVGADLIGGMAVPYIEEQFIDNETLQKVTKVGLPPALAGAAHLGAKRLLTTANSNPAAEEFFLGAGVKLAADSFVDRFYPGL